MNCLAMSLMFVYVDWILLASPDKERWHKIQYHKEADITKEKNVEIPQSFLARLWWGVRLASTNRYTGWSQQVKNTPVEVSVNYPKWQESSRSQAEQLANTEKEVHSAQGCARHSHVCGYRCA
jgi:hypothetical protein